MAEKAAPYRNELEALRARRDDLEEQLEAERAELERQRDEVKALRQALARRDGGAAPGGREGPAATAARADEGVAAAATRPADALVPRTLVPQRADQSGGFVVLGFCLGAALLAYTNGVFFRVIGYTAVTIIAPAVLYVMFREKRAQRYLKIDLRGVEFRGYDCKVRRVAWADVESTRVVFTRTRYGDTSSVHLRVRGQERWVEFDSDYLSCGQALADLFERYRGG